VQNVDLSVLLKTLSYHTVRATRPTASARPPARRILIGIVRVRPG